MRTEALIGCVEVPQAAFEFPDLREPKAHRVGVRRGDGRQRANELLEVRGFRHAGQIRAVGAGIDRQRAFEVLDGESLLRECQRQFPAFQGLRVG